MDTADLVSKAAEYTEKFVNAAIPVAKKAYEIGLLTLRIDAIQSIVVGIALLCLSAYLYRKLWLHKRECMNKCTEHCAKFYEKYEEHSNRGWTHYSQHYDVLGYLLTSVLSLIPAIISAVILLDVWLWIKLFSPDLWLAKQAIDAVLRVATK